MADLFRDLADFIQSQYATAGKVALHEPRFGARERECVLDTLDSTFVSSVGPWVVRFESEIARHTGAQRAVATANGTAALHTALLLAGVRRDDLVITQSLSFVATCNAIAYCGASPAFVDVDRDTLGLSPGALARWLGKEAVRTVKGCIHRASGRTIRAVVPMHTFGHPADLDGLLAVCADWGLPIVEDAAESLGSLYKGRHTGTFGLLGTLSFNGNKIITTGGGGMVLTMDEALGSRARHLTTTARVPQGYEFVHDEVGYNYRMPNLNAALGCAQLEKLEGFVAAKRRLAGRYRDFFKSTDYQFVNEPLDARSNYWLNAVLCPDRAARDALLEATNALGIMTRPAWQLLHRSPMYKGCPAGPLTHTKWLEARIVNLPSSVPPGDLP